MSSLWAITLFWSVAFMVAASEGLRRAAPLAPQPPALRLRLGDRAPSREEVDRHAREDDREARPGGLRPEARAPERDRRRRDDVERGDPGIAPGAVGALRVGPATPEREEAGDRRHVEDQDREDDVLEERAVEVAVGLRAARVAEPRAGE